MTLLKVYIAHTGRSFEYKIRASDSIRSLSRVLAKQADINTTNQIIIASDGVRLNDTLKFGNYPLFSSDNSSSSDDNENNDNKIIEAYLFDSKYFVLNKNISSIEIPNLPDISYNFQFLDQLNQYLIILLITKLVIYMVYY